MPTYEYLCKNCGHTLEELQSMTEPPLTTCPKCSQETLARVMGGGGGLIFKGSGFYLTDYKKTSSPPATGSSKKADTPSTPATPAPPADSPKKD
jgi:putative FmdB family regulatory protein